MSWATVTGKTNGNSTRPPGTEVFNSRSTNMHEEADLDPSDYRKSPMRRNNQRATYMSNERDRGGNPNERDRGGNRHDRYAGGNRNNYSPHTSTTNSGSYGREHGGGDKRGGFKQFQKYDDYPTSYNSYQNNTHTTTPYNENTQLSDSLFHQPEEQNSTHAEQQQQHQSHIQPIQTKYQNTQMVTKSGTEFGLPDRKDEESNLRFNRHTNSDEVWLGKSSANNECSTPHSPGQDESKTKWKSRRVEEKRRQQQEQNKKRQWWYRDPQDEVQGPFSEEEMRDWFHEKYFNVELPVRCHPETLFIKLGDWFKQGNTAFLEELPPEYEQYQKNNNNNTSSEIVAVSNMADTDVNQRTLSPQNPQSSQPSNNSTTIQQSNNNNTMANTSQTTDSRLQNTTTSNSLSMDPLGTVIQEASHQPQQVGFSTNRTMHLNAQQRFPGGSTLNRDAPTFNPSERYQPAGQQQSNAISSGGAGNNNTSVGPPTNTTNNNVVSPTSFNSMGTKNNNTLPPTQQSNDPNLFSPYRSQGFTQQHDLRQTPGQSAFEPAHNTIQTTHTRPPQMVNRFDSGGLMPPKQHAFSNYAPTQESSNAPSPNRHMQDSVLTMNRFHQQQHVPPQTHGNVIQNPNGLNNSSHQQQSFYDQNSILQQNKPSVVKESVPPPTVGPTQTPGPTGMLDMLTSETSPIIEDEPKVKESANSGAWNEIGMTTTPTRGPRSQGSPLNSPFGNVGPSAGDFGQNNSGVVHKQNKQIENNGGASGGWGRSPMDDVKKAATTIHDERDDSQTMRRQNEHVQIQRNRSPQERNFSWGMNGGQNVNSNNHMQRNRNQNGGDMMGAKPRSSWNHPGQNSSWDAGRPRIAQQNRSNQNSRNSPTNRSNQWNSGMSKSNNNDDFSNLGNNQSNKSSAVSSPIVTNNVKSNPSSTRASQKSQMVGHNRRINKERSTRKPLINKGDPALSSSTSSQKRTTNVSTKVKKNNSCSESNPFGIKISKDFEDWCLKQLNEIQREQLDGRSLIHFLMTLKSNDEIRTYISTYLGDSSQTREFADGFITHKKFEDDSVGEPFQETKRRRKRRRKKNTQHSEK